MAVTFSNLGTEGGLKHLDEYLLTRSYITGYQASKDDITVYCALSEAPGSDYVNASRWYNHIASLLIPSFSNGVGVKIGSEKEQSSPAPETPPPASSKVTNIERGLVESTEGKVILCARMMREAWMGIYQDHFKNVCAGSLSIKSILVLERGFSGWKAAGYPVCQCGGVICKRNNASSTTMAPAEDEDDDDDVDLFGEETEEEKKAAEERAKSVKAAIKKKESGKSSVLLDVKPWDDETDMKKLEEAVRSIKMEGLLWGASKLVPVGYGIKKLQIMMSIVDDLVSVDSLVEDYLTIEPCNEYVQSCDIVAFNKI